MPIARAFREDRAEDVQIRSDAAELGGQPGGKALGQKASRGMFGCVEVPAKSSKGIAMDLGREGPHVHDVKSGARSDIEREFNWRHSADQVQEKSIRTGPESNHRQPQWTVP